MTTPSPRRPWWRRWFGDRSERAAARHLRRSGLRVLARNVWTAHGEIDLVALDGAEIVFVEVRSTEAPDTARPAESVGPAKQARLTRSALDWLRRHRLLGRPARFDVVLISWPPDRREPTVEHLCRAFESVGRWQMFS